MHTQIIIGDSIVRQAIGLGVVGVLANQTVVARLARHGAVGLSSYAVVTGLVVDGSRLNGLSCRGLGRRDEHKSFICRKVGYNRGRHRSNILRHRTSNNIVLR